MFSRKFIAASDAFCDYENPVNAPLFRKTFNLERLPETAYFTLCGLGFYELYINGKRLTKGALAPYINNPDDVLYYDKYDIKQYLTVGQNAITVMLGNGFFNCFGGIEWDFEKASWRGPLRLAFALRLDSTVIEADESVKTAPSPVLFDDLRIGAFYDARLEKQGFCDALFDDGDWDNAKFIESPKGTPRLCEADPVVVYKELEPVKITHFNKLFYACKHPAKYRKPFKNTLVRDVYMYDFGENNTGVCRLKIKGARGQTVTLRFGEHLVNEKFSLRSTLNMCDPNIDNRNRFLEFPQMDKFTLSGNGEETYIPPFTYHGFRYCLVEGITKEQATEDLLTYMVIGSDINKKSDFSCSDEALNRLYDMTCRSVRSNLTYVPTDCPHREKNGWTADISLSAEHVMLSFTAEKTLSEWLSNLRAAQRDGAFPGIVPTAGWGFEWGNGPGWDSASVYLPYYIYKYCGDKTVIEDNLPAISRYLDYAATKRDERGLLEYGLIDWAQPYYKCKDTLSPLIFTDSAVVYDMCKKTAHLAQIVGNTAVKLQAETLANELKTAIRTHLLDLNTMTAVGECETSQTLALEFGLFEGRECEKAAKLLAEIVEKYDNHIVCGVIGARFLFHTLVKYGYTDLALSVIKNPTYPSYIQWVNRGDTTLCEGFSKEGKGERGGRDSRNHHFWGDVSSFLIQCIAGLRPNPNTTDVNEYLIAPNFPKNLNFASAKYNEVSVRWDRVDDGIVLSVSAPKTAHGKIVLPTGFAFDGKTEKPLENGNYFISKI